MPLHLHTHARGTGCSCGQCSYASKAGSSAPKRACIRVHLYAHIYVYMRTYVYVYSLAHLHLHVRALLSVYIAAYTGAHRFSLALSPDRLAITRTLSAKKMQNSSVPTDMLRKVRERCTLPSFTCNYIFILRQLAFSFMPCGLLERTHTCV